MFEDALMIPPMKIWEAPEGKEDKVKECINSGEYFGSVKKDGFYYQLEKTLNKNIYLFSQTVSQKNGLRVEKGANVPHIIDHFKNIPDGTILVGEIYYPGKTSKDVTSIMGCLPEKAIKRQEGNPIHFYLHDILYLDGQDLREKGALARYRILEKLCADYNLVNDFIELAECVEENLDSYIQKNFVAGEEGTVLKKKDMPYKEGKRPAWSSLKFKTEKTVDVVICGLIPATREYTGKDLENWIYWEKRGGINKYGEFNWYKTEGNYYQDYVHNPDIYTPVTRPYFNGWYTSLKIGYYDNDELVKTGTVSSGLTDEMCADMTENPDKYISSTIEVKCMSVDKEALSIRHPRFKRMREDKNAIECTKESIFG